MRRPAPVPDSTRAKWREAINTAAVTPEEERARSENRRPQRADYRVRPSWFQSRMCVLRFRQRMAITNCYVRR